MCLTETGWRLLFATKIWFCCSNFQTQSKPTLVVAHIKITVQMYPALMSPCFLYNARVVVMKSSLYPVFVTCYR